MKIELNKEEGTGKVYYELASGSVALGNSHYSPYPGISTVSEESINSIPSDFHELVPIMRGYYEHDGLFGTVVDVLVQLTIDGAIHVLTEDKETEEFFNGIIETSNLKRALKWMALETTLFTNGWSYRTKKGSFTTSRKGVKVPEYEWTILNPSFVRVEGSLINNMSSVTLVPNDEFVDLMANIKNTELKDYMPKEFINPMKKGEGIVLPNDSVYHVARNKQPYQRYAPVALKRVIRPLRMKQKYMQMDMSTANGIINQIVVFKLGNDEFPIVSDAPLVKFSRLLETPSKAYQLVWNHALEIDYIRSDPKALDPTKYEPINKELMYGFAVPETLLGGGQSGYSKDFVAVKSFVKRLEWAKEDLECWIENEFKRIAQENNLKTWPKVKLGNINLDEDRTFKNVLMNLYEHGVLSAQTLLSEIGYEFLTEVERMKLEKVIKEKQGLLQPNSPYHQSSKKPGRPDGTPELNDRDDRTPNPQPIGASSMAKGEVDDFDHEGVLKSTALLFLFELEGIYDRLQDTYLKDSGEDSGKFFVEEVMEVTERILWDSFSIRFLDVAGFEPDRNEELAFFALLLEWCEKNIKRLHETLEEVKKRDYPPEMVEAIFEKEKYRLQMYAREGVKKALSSGKIQAHNLLGVKMGIWYATLRNTCEVCLALHEKVMPLEEIWSMLPVHPNCECYYEPIFNND